MDEQKPETQPVEEPKPVDPPAPEVPPAEPPKPEPSTPPVEQPSKRFKSLAALVAAAAAILGGTAGYQLGPQAKQGDVQVSTQPVVNETVVEPVRLVFDKQTSCDIACKKLQYKAGAWLVDACHCK